MNLADLLVQNLANAGIKRIWGITGDSLNAVNDSLRRNGRIEFMHVRHEESAAFAAGAEAALTGELSVCAGSCGPGNLHLINGLFDCKRNHVPVLAIASHIPSSEIGLDYFQETHPQDLFKECSDFCELVTNPKQMPEVLHRAMSTALSKRTVAVIVLPGDVTLLEVPKNASVHWTKPVQPRLMPTEAAVNDFATLVNESKNITIFTGSGCAGYHDEVVAFSEKIKAPIVHALRGKEFMEYDNPNDVGMTGLIGFSSGYHAMLNSDLLIMLGTDFPYRPFYPHGKKVIQVDINAGNIGKRVPVALGLVADVKEVIDAVMLKVAEKTNRSFLDKARQHYADARKDLDALAKPAGKGKPIHPQYLVKVLSDLAAEDTVFTADVGTPVAWSARYLKMNGKRRLLGSFNHGSMANAMVQAMGAQAVDRSRQVVSLSGDGGFAMLMGDLLTLKQLNLPVKIVIVNNSVLGFVSIEMKASGYLDYATNLDNPNFADVAKAVGIKAVRIEESDELEDKLKAALAEEGPVVIDVVTATQELLMPPKIEAAHAKGFGLFMLKALISGRGDEIKELVEENWLS